MKKYIYKHPKLSALVPGVEDVGFPDTVAGASWAMVQGRQCHHRQDHGDRGVSSNGFRVGQH